jgi:SAM-dependent methyltransferase
MFKSKSSNYELYRPNYPNSLVSFLREQNLLKKTDLVAEFGCGTGKLTGMILENGNLVFGVEQDEEMQNFLITKFSTNQNFNLLKKSAEDTGLPKCKFDLIIAAQSFHLFDPIKAKNEFYRILKPNGNIVFVWYHWNMNQEISHKIRNLFYSFQDKQQQQERIQIGLDFFTELFSPNGVTHRIIDTITQRFSKSEFLKSMLSSSYASTPIDKLHVEYLKEAENIFDQYSKNNYVEYSFNLELYALKVEETINIVA